MAARLEDQGEGSFAVLGELNFATVQKLWEESTALFRQRPPLSIDLGGVSRSDSTGVALLVEWLRLVRSRGTDLRFRNIPSQMEAIIQIADLEELLVSSK